MGRKTRWSRQEDEILVRMYPDMPTQDVAERVGRPADVVSSRARYLGLHKSTVFMTTSRTACGDSWRKPVGTEFDQRGVLFRKIGCTGSSANDWRPVHIIEWELANGPVPDGHVVIFADGNRRNFAQENLLCLSRAELMARNTIQRYPPELRHAMRLVTKLHREIANEKQD